MRPSRHADDPQDRFLKLLVTQMKNQDPLNPLDNAQVTSQLAQISTVNGIEKLNATHRDHGKQLQRRTNSAGGDMIGKDVLVPGSMLQVAGGGGIFGVDLAQAADQVKVTIHDASGREIRTMDLDAQAAGPLALHGMARRPMVLRPRMGSYSLSVTALRGDQKVDAQTLASGIVRGVSRVTRACS